MRVAKKWILISLLAIIAAATFGWGLYTTRAMRAACVLQASDGAVAILTADNGQSAAANETRGMRRIASFRTSIATSGADRRHNVALATSNFSWLAVQPGGVLSFNAVVGLRTIERGYREAKVIVGGEYVPGVGGGVCQVSSTLYNAWIRAGLGVESVRAHSLPSSYCDLSQDATVTEWIDLVLVNDSNADVLINGYLNGDRVVFDLYGTPSGYEIEIVSEIERTVPPPAAETIYVPTLDGYGAIQTDEYGSYVTLRASKNGLCTLAREIRRRDGQIVSERVLRRDTYATVQGKIARVQSASDTP